MDADVLGLETFSSGPFPDCVCSNWRCWLCTGLCCGSMVFVGLPIENRSETDPSSQGRRLWLEDEAL